MSFYRLTRRFHPSLLRSNGSSRKYICIEVGVKYQKNEIFVHILVFLMAEVTFGPHNHGKMQVLGPKAIWVITPKIEGNVGSHGMKVCSNHIGQVLFT